MGSTVGRQRWLCTVISSINRAKVGMQYKDYYEILGVGRDADADEVKRAYRKLARKYHPDVSKEKNAESKFKEVQEAYEVLRDPEKRAAYDQLGRDYRQDSNSGRPPTGRSASGTRAGSQRFSDLNGFSDFFSSLFGGATGAGAAGPRRMPGTWTSRWRRLLPAPSAASRSTRAAHASGRCADSARRHARAVAAHRRQRRPRVADISDQAAAALVCIRCRARMCRSNCRWPPGRPPWAPRWRCRPSAAPSS